MTELLGVYGAAGCGRGIMPLLRSQYPGLKLVFIDDGLESGTVNGHELLGWTSFLERDAREKAVIIAISASSTRQSLAEKCAAADIPLIEARASSVVQMDDVVIGDGACLSPFVTLTSNIRIGRCFHANLYAYVEHDCVIGDFVTFAPGVMCNGNVRIEDHAYIGAGAIIRQGKPGKPLVIGEGAVVGMGAVVTRSVAPGATVIGNPARPLIKD